ncbi:hypothetical protein [Glutamicibacter arilaitensis]|uniref:hypothetical protein n=1 Tax=Glutamicibacter arilaitensis TaxID=256701 RepID=UPI003850AC18
MSIVIEPPERITERRLLDFVPRALQDRLPSGWTVGAPELVDGPDTGIDAFLSFSAPTGQSARIAIETKRVVEPRNIMRMRERLDPARNSRAWDAGLVVARYLSPTVRARLIEAGLSFVDATGNIYIRSDTPPLFIGDRGLDHDPWRGPGRPRGTLKGAPAAQVVRALLDAPGPWRMRELIASAQASTGSVYRVVEFLESEDLLTRNNDSTIIVPDWVSVLRRWSADYEFLSTNTVSRWIAPRGVDSVIRAALITDSSTYAVTGSIAAATWASYAPARSLMAYTSNATEIAKQWGLRATDTGANVLIAEPAYPALTRGAFQRADGLSIAAPIQVATDLLTGPGRAPSEAEELIDWMVSHESDWR